VKALSAEEKIRNWSMPIPWTGCWLWTGSVASHGYGDLRLNKKTKLAHRLSWELANGHIPDGYFVLHRCDVRLCVNPSHLFLGTTTDNMRDKVKKGRHSAGWCHEKLTAEQVEQIRFLRASGLKLKEVGKLFNRHPDHIRKITNHKVWG
jgi:hypothetical protein